MTNPTSGAADLPEALRLAAWLQEGAWHQMRLGDVEAAGRELRRLHIEITDLRAQLESIGAGGVSGRLAQAISAEPAAHVQNPAENEHVADDMSKNETGSNTAQPAPPADSVLEDAAFEAVRKKLCALPCYSFVLDDDGVVRRVQDRTGNWIEFDEAHALFDHVAVDAARNQGGSDD